MGNRYIETYGKQLIREALDIILINQGLDDERARLWLIKHGVIKKSTKQIRMIMSKYETRRAYEPGRGHYDLPEPYWTYNIWAKNGRNQQIFSFMVRSDKIGELMEELENDTITN